MKRREAEKIIKDGMDDRYHGRYPEALDKFDLVIKELAASDDKDAKLIIGEAMHQIGVTLQNIGKDYKAALSCLWCAIAYRQAIHDPNVAYSYFQIPMCRLASGEKVEDVMPDFMKAEKAIVVAISLATRIDNFKILGDMWHNTAYICQMQQNYQDALAAYGKALAYRRKSEDKRGAGLTLARLAECYLKLKDKEGAKLQAEEALKIFQEIGDVNRIKQAERTLQEIEQEEQKELERTIFEGRK